ncbi:AAA family ATPase [Flavobacterium sp.]|jgi:predicted ATP-binding protein involved in virulence|uniref:AAA family ATPase n=1 Tax=Flavobacterium sp. TaxID=239 RepID=UPI0037C1549E
MEIKNLNRESQLYFISLDLGSVGCFKEAQKLDLSDSKGKYSPWTIILGDNGSGKTTLLKVIANSFIFNEFKNNQKFYSQKQPLTIITNPNGIYNSKSFVRYRLNNDTNKKDYFISINSDKDGSNVKELTFDADLNNLLLFSYGASRRMSKNPSFSSNSFNQDKLSSLFDESVELINVEEWYLQKYLAVQTSDIEIKNQLVNQLEIIKNILIDFLPDVFDLRIKEVKNLNDKSSLEVKINTKDWINLRDLSFGYQTITALLVDIASKMMEEYPEKDNPLEQPVIILIDEIDLHLHPKWQRTVINKLSHHFPKAQFIVTAHSPLIVQAAQDRNANIVVCRKEGDKVVIDNNPESVKGWRIDQILTSDLFEVESPRSKETQKAVDDYIKLKGKKNLAKSDLEKLESLSPLVQEVYGQKKEETELDIKLKKFAEKYLK